MTSTASGPTSKQGLIDFNGRTGYVRTALEADVPIVPVVSLGGQESQLYLWHGEPLAKLFGLQKLMRSDYFPVSLGFPFGLTFAFPPNLPLPTKITTQVLDPVAHPGRVRGRPRHRRGRRRDPQPHAGGARPVVAGPALPHHRLSGPAGMSDGERRAAARQRLGRARWRTTTLVRAGLIAPLRPDKYLRMGQVFRRYGVTPTTGLSLAAVRRPDGVGLVDELGSLTWGELGQRSDALAAGLAEMRTPAGRPVRTVAILCRNHRGFVDSLGAAAKLGANALLLNTGFSGPQLADVVAREGAELVIYDEEFASLVEHARTEVDDLLELVAWQDQPGGEALGEVKSLEDVIAAHRGAVPEKPERSGKVILLTSGTTGTPKGAARGADGGTDAMAAMLDRIPWRSEEVTVVAAPMFHAWGFGQLVIAATLTCTVVTRRRFDPEATLEMVRGSGATGLGVVPVMIERIMELPAAVLDRYPLKGQLRFVTASGSRMRSDAVISFMDRFGDTIYNSYNATEAGLISTAVPADLRVAPDTAGKPVVGTELRILDDSDREVPQGEVGRITVRSGFQFSGYTSGDTKTFLGDYMVSGDVGRVDEAGRLYVVGRDDEMIVSGGENVYPLEVEETLNGHSAVREAAVLGVDDKNFGQRLAAYVALEPGAEVSADDLRAHVKSQLAGYKVPRDVTFVDELPRNASGKVMKRELPTGESAP